MTEFASRRMELEAQLPPRTGPLRRPYLEISTPELLDWTSVEMVDLRAATAAGETVKADAHRRALARIDAELQARGA